MTRMVSSLACWVVLAACGGATPHGVATVDYQGHRGARGLRPENTLGGFAYAIAVGVDTIEMDVMLTRDDVLVVHHDTRLDPNITRDATGAWLETTGPAVRSLTLAALRTYDVGRIRPGTAYAARFPAQVGRDGVVIPTLAEVIALAERRSLGRIRYNIEIKTAPDDPAASSPERVAEALVTLVRRSGIAARTTIQSFDWRSLAHVHAIAPELRRSCLTADSNVGPDKITWTAGLDPATHGSVPRLVHAFGCDVWSPDADTVTPAAIAEAHRLELLVIPWTVNRPAEIERLLAVGVDGVITDVPDRLPRR